MCMACNIGDFLFFIKDMDKSKKIVYNCIVNLIHNFFIFIWDLKKSLLDGNDFFVLKSIDNNNRLWYNINVK